LLGTFNLRVFISGVSPDKNKQSGVSPLLSKLKKQIVWLEYVQILKFKAIEIQKDLVKNYGLLIYFLLMFSFSF